MNTKTKTPKTVKKSLTRTVERDSGDGFIRTAIVVAAGSSNSLDVIDETGKRLGQINVFVDRTDKLCFMVDVIDVDNLYEVRRALTFGRQQGRLTLDVPADGNLVASHFEVKT